MIRLWAAALLCFHFELAFGLCYSPWFSKAFELVPSFKYRYQHYQSSNDHFFTAGIGITPGEYWNMQAAFTAAQTARQKQLHANDVQFLVRYQLSNDVVGDTVSSAAGLTITEASQAARRDPGVFVHGTLAGELHYAVGMELAPPFQPWNVRFWGLGAVGFGSGAPWIRMQGEVEIQPASCWIHSLCLEMLRGLGSHALRNSHFHGYSHVKHQSVDIGWRTCYSLSDMQLSAFLAYRIFARNCPRQALQASLAIHLPFGL